LSNAAKSSSVISAKVFHAAVCPSFPGKWRAPRRNAPGKAGHHRYLGGGGIDVAEIVRREFDWDCPMFSCKRCSFVVPGIGTIHGFWAAKRGAIWAGVGFSLSVMLPSRLINAWFVLSASGEKAQTFIMSLRAPFQISIPCNCRAWRRLRRRLFCELHFHDRPLRRAEDDKGDAAAGQVLLVAHVFIGGDNDIETAASAAASKSPLLRVSQPRSLALVTVWPTSASAMPFGVTWSKRMSIEGGGRRWSVEAAAGKLKYLVDLFARDVELFDDFIDRGARFEVLEYGGDGHARIAKHPCTAQATGNAFDGLTLRPVKCRHLGKSFHC
jgi:hypothetical protein